MEAALLFYDWHFWARPEQKPPPGEWLHWLVLAGRGFGKTRTGAEWVRGLAEKGDVRRIALVAPTAGDARQVMIEGDSGILAVSPPWFRPKYEPSKRRLLWPNGVIATVFSADEPERLRGPQHEAAWLDELCAWRYDDMAFDMLMFGLRLGARPRTCITTTPKPSALIKKLLASQHVALVHGTSYDNLDNLAPSFRDTVLARYEGTRLGRQELNAEIIDDVPGALWQRAMLENCRLDILNKPILERVIVAVDPPASSGAGADECGIVVAGRSAGKAYVLGDYSARMSPLEWAKMAVKLYHEFKADRIIAEVNQGGDMVLSLLQQVDAAIPLRRLHASRGKYARAEPVAALYEQGRVYHVGQFPLLEDQMCRFTGSRTGASPDRLDALVWALSDLLLSNESNPRVRSLR